ncbi:MAG: menaquinol oxidoreductase, partial [Bacteroidetes bacterium]|nr:menaquinol oxidoreductase [Bacteroidota bacterium]
NHKTFLIACAAVFLSIWIDKGLGLVITGFIPSPFGKVIQYWPTLPESLIALGIWAIGFFFITIFYKMALSIRREVEA